MAKQNINVGTKANDKAGDPLRTAFTKINDNFTELYTLTGGTSTALIELAQDYAAPMFNHASHTNITATYDDANNKILLTGVASAVWPVANTNNEFGPTRIAIGNSAGGIAQGSATVAVGSFAGNDTQGGAAVAIGTYAGTTTQRNDAIAIGYLTGNDVQGTGAVSIGRQAGQTSQGAYSIAIGKLAGQTSQAANTIILNSTNSALNGVASQTNSFYVSPIRSATATSDVLYYNTTTKEITYAAAGSVSSLVNSTKTVSLASTGVLSLPAQTVPLTTVSQITSATINRTGASTDVTAIADAQDLWFGAEQMWVDIRDQDAATIAPATRTWAGLPSWEAYPLILAYTSGGGTGVSSFPSTTNAARNAYLAYKELASSIDIVSGDKVFSFENTGTLRVPGVITKDNSLILQSSGVSGVLPTGNSASINPDGQYGRVLLRTDNGTTLRTWQFDVNGNTTFPTGLVLGAPRGVGTVNFTCSVDKEFQIETGTASAGRLWQFGTTGTTTFPSGLTLHRLSSSYSNITADLNKILQVATQTSGGRKEWSFGTDGVLTVPGTITKANTLQITSSGATNAAAVIASGDNGRVTLRTDNGTTNKDWYFNIDGVLTTAGSVKLPNDSELRPSTAAYDSALASWEYIRSGEIAYKIANNLATAEGWPMVNWHPTGLTAQSYIDFLLNAWTVQNTQGATLIVYPAMSSSFYQQMRAILINIRDNYSLTSSGVSISSGYARSWNFNEDGKLTFPDGTSQTGAGVQSIHGSLTTANAGGYTVTRNGLTVSIVWDNTSGVAGIIKIAFDSNINVTERTVTLRASSQVNSSYIGTNTALTATQTYTIATLTNLGDFSTTHIITGNYNIYRITTVLQQADAPGGNPVAAGYATIEQLR